MRGEDSVAVEAIVTREDVPSVVESPQLLRGSTSHSLQPEFSQVISVHGHDDFLVCCQELEAPCVTGKSAPDDIISLRRTTRCKYSMREASIIF